MTNRNSRTQEMLIGRIIRLTNQVMEAVDADRIDDASAYLSERSECLDLLGKIRTCDVNTLPNYPLFINTLVRFDRRFGLCA